ncbi:MAG: transglutaminase family protein [Pseudoclavibacter sp.]
MSRIRINHLTGYRYDGPADTSYNEARMLPSSTNEQFVLLSHLEVSPNSSTHSYVDYWGTRVTSFEVLTPHDELSITASSLVEIAPQPESDAEGLSFEGVADARTRSVGLVELSTQTELTAPPDEVVDLAFEAKARSASPAEAARNIAEAVYDAVAYEAGVTGVRTTAREAWAHRRGVCQDITHIALGAMRRVGIPARYVSGYHHPNPSSAIGETVTGESHAWIEVWNGAWRGWDVTNNAPIGERHVLVGHGRDYNDVPPLRGVYAGSDDSELFVKVEITREA